MPAYPEALSDVPPYPARRIGDVASLRGDLEIIPPARGVFPPLASQLFARQVLPGVPQPADLGFHALKPFGLHFHLAIGMYGNSQVGRVITFPASALVPIDRYFQLRLDPLDNI